MALSACCCFLFYQTTYAESLEGKPDAGNLSDAGKTSIVEPPFLETEDTQATKPSETEEKLLQQTTAAPESEQQQIDNQSTLSEPPGDPEEIESRPPFFSFLDEHQKTVSSYLQQYVQGVDNFFSNETSIEEKTGSYLRVQLESNWSEGAGMKFKGKASLRLHLRKTQRKLKLVIASDVDEQKSALERETGEINPASDGNKGLYTGIEREYGKPERWKIRPSLGIKIRSPLDWYAKLRAQRQVEFEKWLMSFHETLYWFDSSGIGTDSILMWDRKINDDLLFRTESFLRYTDINDYFEMSQTFSLVQTLSQKRAITYKIGAFGRSEDPALHATEYLINALYRNNIHKDYLFLDIQPQILFEKQNDFKGRVELLVRLELFYRG